MNNQRVKINVVAGLYFLSVVLVSVVILKAYWPVDYTSLKEAAAFFIMFMSFVNVPAVQSFVARVPRLYLIIFLALLFFCLVGQYINRPKATYPFLSFTMYGREFSKDRMDYIEFVGVDEQGERHVFLPTRDFPSMSHGRLVLNLGHRARMVHNRMKNPKTPVPQKDEAGRPVHVKQKVIAAIQYLFEEKESGWDSAEVLDDFLNAVGNKYNKNHPSKPFKSIEVYEIFLDLDYKDGVKELERVRLWSTDIKG